MGYIEITKAKRNRGNTKRNYSREYKGFLQYGGSMKAYLSDRSKSAPVPEHKSTWRANKRRWDWIGIDTPENVFYSEGKYKNRKNIYKQKYRKKYWKAK